MKDQLSALIDGELDIDSAEHVFTAAKSESELKSAWQHYHLIGDALRGDILPDEKEAISLSDKVMQSIEAEPTVLAVNKQKLDATDSKKISTFSSNNKIWSIAASVAAVMFVGLMVLQQQLGSSEDLSPIELANSVPMEYLQAHQSSAPSGSAYYIQAASFPEPSQ